MKLAVALINSYNDHSTNSQSTNSNFNSKRENDLQSKSIQLNCKRSVSYFIFISLWFCSLSFYSQQLYEENKKRVCIFCWLTKMPYNHNTQSGVLWRQCFECWSASKHVNCSGNVQILFLSTVIIISILHYYYLFLCSSGCIDCLQTHRANFIWLHISQSYQR